MNPGGKTYSAGNSGHEPPPGFLFTNSTGKGRDLIAANTCGLHVAPIGWSRAWWKPTGASLPARRNSAGLEPIGSPRRFLSFEVTR
jgi:hypothetical protein